MNNNDALQIIVTILGVLNAVAVLIKQITPKRVEEERTLASVGAAPHEATGQRTKSFLDLSFVLLCSAFFSLLLMDSLVISGRTPSPGVGTILAVVMITAMVFAVMFVAWRLKQSEMVTGFLAITTLAVLIISPGGPFKFSHDSTKDVQVGLQLYIPVLSLITIASAMMIYSFGSPLSSMIAPRKRYLVSFALGALVIVGTGTLGQHLITKVMEDPNTPKVESEKARRLLGNISSWQLPQRQSFYQLAAEISLARKYQEYNQQIRKQQQQMQPTPQPTPTPSPSLSPSPTPQSTRTAAGVRNATTPTVTPTPSASPRNARATNGSTVGADAGSEESDIENENAPTEPRPGSGSKKKENTLFTSAGSDRIDTLLDRFRDLPIKAEEKYLEQRLDWIHPVGRGQAQSSLPLTGIKIEDRFQRIGMLRLFVTLEEQPTLRQKLLREFYNYPGVVVDQFSPDLPGVLLTPATIKQDRSKLPKVIQILLPDKEGKYKLALFPGFDSSEYSPSLRMQLSLPIEVESSLAYNEYAHLALQLLKDKANNPQSETHYNEIADAFRQMSDSSQNALRYYVANDKSLTEVLRELAQLSDVKNFSALTKGGTSAPYTLKSSLESYSRALPSQPPSGEPPLKQLAYEIAAKNNPNLTATVLGLLGKEDPSIPIQPLFESKVFDFAKKFDESLAGDAKQDFFNVIVDPVWYVVKNLRGDATASPAVDDKLATALDVFRNDNDLSDAERDSILHQLAISLYQPGGDYSLDPISLLIVQAKTWSEAAALVCAAIIMLPLLVLCALCGGYFARKLVARDRMRELISKELEGYSEVSDTIGTPVELYGRDDVLRNLHSLAERGWSTIGVVGRRGVGKSRILNALSKEDLGREESPAVKVWVASPSRFQEDDFIASIFERLAISTEGAVATFLGAKPLSIRRIESRAMRVSLWYYAGALTLFLFVTYQMYDRLTRADIVITWLPIAALLFSSLFLLLHYVSKLQPVDLSSWLQRDRAHNPHTVMLYREVNEALKFLNHRARQPSGDRAKQRGIAVRSLVMNVLFATLLISLGYFLLAQLGDLISGSASFWDAALPLLVIFGSIGGWVLLYQQKDNSEESAAARGQSIMSLIADYRSFASTIVYRLKQGALGESARRKFSVLICIDELDKIVDFEEIRAFVRRIKAIFEVPGVYYYVSLAEDTLKSLYLGAAAGKNEIDSSFDHIVRIPPLSCDVGESIAASYLQSHSSGDLPPRLARVIATLSYGVPRDIIRRCDEFIARSGVAKITPAQMARELRQIQAGLAYELRQLASRQVDDFGGNALHAALTAQQLLVSTDGADGDPEQLQRRLILSLWIITLSEIAVDLLDDKRWREISEELCQVGYKLSVDQISDLLPQVEQLHASIAADSMSRAVH